MKTVAIIQARLGSTRLPGKVLLDVAGQTMLERVVQRVACCETIDQIVIATTDQPADRPLIDYCDQKHWNFFAGSEQDVLSRYVGAAKAYHADRIIRITSDCPLIDPGMIDELVGLAATSRNIDYVCNFHPQRRFPRGLDCEVLTRETLERVHGLVTEPSFREHVTLYVYRNAHQFTLASLECERDWSHFRWTVDSEADLQLVNTVYQHFGQSSFDWKQVVAAFETHPGWIEINRHMIQKVA